MPRVWNRHHPYPPDAVYCGRGSPHGNPFRVGVHGDRAKCIRMFEELVLPHLDVSMLRGKDLLCSCAPKPCHCDPILRKANMDDDDTFDCPLPGIGHNSGGIAGAIAASMSKWIRKPSDLYPTPPDVTFSLLPHIEHLLPVGSRVLEPACADGQMSKALEEFGYRVDSYDLRTDVKYGQGGFDFLAEHGTVYDWEGEYDAVITNPPFNAAAEFIRRAVEVAPVVCMLLKAQYWNTDNRKKLFRETKPYLELNLTWRPAFLEAERGKSPLMDCMWIVWKRGHDDLPKVDILDRLMTCPMSEASFGGL